MASAIFKEEEIPDHLLCPICSELPPNEIFQCVEGHVICKKCYNQLTDCPSCSTPFNATVPIRCRYLETQLENILIECNFKPKGCNEVLNRRNLNDHKEKCHFNFKKFGNLISVCKQIGYLDCDFKFNFGNVEAGVDHLISVHGWVYTKSLKLDLEMAGVFTEENHIEIFTPVVIDVEEKHGYLALMPIIDRNKEELHFNLLWLPYAINKERFEVPVRIKTRMQPLRDESVHLSYVQKPTTLNGLCNVLLTCDFHCIQLPWIKNHCTNKENAYTIQIYVRYDTGNDLGCTEKEKIICTTSCNFSTLVYEKDSFDKFNDIDLDVGKKLKLDVLFENLLLSEYDSELAIKLIQELFERNEPLIGVEKELVENVKKSLIFFIALNGTPEMLKYLINNNEVNSNLIATVDTDALDVEQKLSRKSMKRNYKREQFDATPIFFALQDKNKTRGAEKVRLIVEHNSALAFFQLKIPEVGRANFLHFAVKSKNVEVVKILLESGSAVNSLLQMDDEPFAHTPLDLITGLKINNENAELKKIEEVLLEYGATNHQVTDS